MILYLSALLSTNMISEHAGLPTCTSCPIRKTTPEIQIVLVVHFIFFHFHLKVFCHSSPFLPSLLRIENEPNGAVTTTFAHLPFHGVSCCGSHRIRWGCVFRSVFIVVRTV